MTERNRCHKCGKPGVLTERRPNGNTYCPHCKFGMPTREWDARTLEREQAPDPRDARIAELEAENAHLRALVPVEMRYCVLHNVLLPGANDTCGKCTEKEPTK